MKKKLRILQSCIIQGTIYRKDQVVELDDKVLIASLLSGKLAEEVSDKPKA